MDLIFLNGLPIEVKHERPDPSHPAGYWKHDKIYIHDPLGDISEEEVVIVKEYLYNEGFIQDGRTPHTVVRGDDDIKKKN